MSAVWQEDMGFHSARSAACNKNTGYCCVMSDFRHKAMVYRCDYGDIGQERMGYRSGMRVWVT